MDLRFDQSLAEGYKSLSQRVRRMSEPWVCRNAYCVKCGHELSSFDNNNPAGDFYCEGCREEFELKSKKSEFGQEILGASYSALIKKIENSSVPNFFLLSYYPDEYLVNNLMVIPGYYFTKRVVAKKPPLGQNARRAGWTGYTINLAGIPLAGRIYLVRNEKIIDKNAVISRFNKTSFLKGQREELKGWLLDIMKCIDFLGEKDFTLDEIYAFEKALKQKHPNNNHIRDKIRQQLQILRDHGYLKFAGRGEYRIV